MRQLWLDCDGVLADFDGGFEKEFGMLPRVYEKQIGTKAFWKVMQEHKGFYESLPTMKDAYDLYVGVVHLGYTPKILTGLPLGDWAAPQKRAWAAKHFPDVDIICCMSKDKRNHMRPGDILIDDYLKYKHLWEEAGGIFIHHTSAAQSLEALAEIQ